MVERRKPLILASTRAIVDSVLSSTKPLDDARPSPSPLRLRAGILRRNDVSGIKSNEDCFSVAVSVSVLKKLAVTTGSLVLIKNPETNVGRIVKTIVLDPPTMVEKQECDAQPVSNVMNILPCIQYPQKVLTSNAKEVAYVTPLLAFNLGLHISCLNLLVRSGQEHLHSLFDTEENESKNMADIYLQVEIVPWLNVPKYASNLRVSFLKIPECGYLDSIRGHSTVEEGDRQDLMDSALNDYFRLDRFLATGDVFSIALDWKCTPDTCVACDQKRKSSLFTDRIYFKVMGIEPSDEPVRVNCTQTALVLGGGATSSISPDILFADSNYPMPVQIDVVKLLGSIIAPALCPSALSSKFKVSIFLYGSAGCGKQAVVRYVGHRLGLHVIEYNCHDFFTSSDREVLVALATSFREALRYSPCMLLLHHFDAFANLSSGDGSSSDQVSIVSQVASVISEFIQPFSEDDEMYFRHLPNNGLFKLEAKSSTSKRVFLVAAADNSDGLQPSIRRCFSHEISMNPLNEKQRASMLRQSVRGISKMLDKSIGDELFSDIVAQTSGFTPRDMDALIADAASSFVYRVVCDEASTVEPENNKVTVRGYESAQDLINLSKSKAMHLDKDDFPNAIERSKKRTTSRLGTPKVPNVKWEDVGGLEEVKKTIRETIQLPLLHKDLFSSGIRKRSGLLFYGPPGTGKTLLAKAVATECSLNFLSVKGPELINMYIGESEKSVRDIFEKARAARPCVIFFDELESLAAARGASGDSGGVMDRVVSQMLTEIDGVDNSNEDLFIIGASNRADLIDPALLRPGRFDKLLYVGINTDTDSRERVLKALTRKIKLHQDVTLSTIANRCPPNFTGADFYALCTDAWSIAAKRTALSSASESDDADSVVVEMNDFIQVMENLKPSVSMAELERYESLRQQFEGRN